MKRTVKTIAGIIAALLLICALFSCKDEKAESGAETRIGTESTDAVSAEAATEDPTRATDPVGDDTVPGTEDGTADALPGAASYDELAAAVCDGFRFTEQKVNCMGQEFLFACIYTCDPENAAALFEERDCARIASLLNDRLFSVVVEKPFGYSITSHTERELTDEMREEVQSFFMRNRESVIGQYGEYYFNKVSEENEGLQAYVFLSYVKADEDGNETSVPEGADYGLNFTVVNGRYYWNDFSLFSSIADNN